jgi:hypothetical protein
MVWILITQNFWIARACKGGHLLRKKKKNEKISSNKGETTNK